MRFFFLMVLGFLPLSAYSLGVTHLIKPNSHFLTTITQGACSTFASIQHSTRCNPALFPYFSSEGLKLNVIGKSDGSSIDSAEDLIFEPISREYLEDLFENNNYNSFTLNSVMAFKTPLFHLSYSPFYLLADFTVFNPGFPEVSLLLINRRSLNISSGFELNDFFNMKTGRLSFGFRAFYYEMDYFQKFFTILELGINDPENVVVFDNKSGVAGDLALFYDTGHSYLPTLALQVKNLNSEIELNEERLVSESFLEPFLLFETYSQLSLGYNFETNFGKFNVEGLSYYNGVFSEVYSDYLGVGLHYTLGLFSVMTSFSKYYQTAGMYFASELAQVGIMYASEDDLGDLSTNNKNDAIYLSLEIGI